MIGPKKHDIEIIQGSKFILAFHQYGDGLRRAEIEAVTIGCPTVIKVTGHGLPSVSNTPIRIKGVKGARALNTGPRECEMVEATVIDPDTFSVLTSTINQRFSPVSGYIEWYAPTDLTNWEAEMQIRDHLGDDTVLVTIKSTDGDIIINPADARVVATIASAVTEALDFTEGVYDLELIDPADERTRVLEGFVTLSKEVTR
jgi:hypothetical protein